MNTTTLQLRYVTWRNDTNRHAESGTSRVHLTESTGLSGETLCGRKFPRYKGNANAGHICRVCKQKAQKSEAETLELAWVPCGDDFD